MVAYFRTVIIVIAIVLLGWGGVYYWQNLRGVGPAIKPPPEDITELIDKAAEERPFFTIPPGQGVGLSNGNRQSENTTDFPLALRIGFSISIFAKNLTTPRVMAFDAFGNLWVSEMNAGAVTLIEVSDGVAQRQNRIFRNLKRPHGIAFDPVAPATLYIAEENKISRARTYSDGMLEKIIDLPGGGRHFSRTIGFGPDGRLNVSIGSSCDVCYEEDEQRAAVYSLNKDGSDFTLFAKGLRNTVFFTWHPTSKEMWGTDMGRDMLGDNLPPDEINIIKEGQNYGWPICYGKNIVDEKFSNSPEARSICAEAVPSHIDLPAHSAPLGLAFIPTNSRWPQEYWGDLLVAYHGSWNRSTPTGYKVVRMKLDEGGGHEGTEDFISGWLVKGSALGRPVDLVFDAQGTLFVSDDKAGVIYKVEYGRE